MSDQRVCAPSAVRTAVAWEALRRVLSDRLAETGRSTLDILDAGGGTGGFAVPLAELGHEITVLDPSPDSLAALERRAGDAGVTGHVYPVQGDTDDVPNLVDDGTVDLVLCHSVLEVLDAPLAALTASTRTLRDGGAVSVLAANRTGAATHRALSGDFEAARRILTDPHGRWGEADPTPHRFTLPELTRLMADAGLRVGEVHGVRVFADLVSNGFVGTADGEPPPGELVDLETVAATDPHLRAIATQLHVVGRL